MALHLIKLCVGISSIEELEEWENEQRAKHKKKKTKTPFTISHVTRQTPTRSEDILAGGSLYWVIGGQISCRRKILDFEATTKNGIPHCRIVMAPQLIRVSPRPFRAFQGWRYLKSVDAPQDLQIAANEDDLIESLKYIGVV
ncbi:MAG: DUF1489 domain-containing protein [Pseudomonadota bacterium]